jgi:Ca2+-binding RTX toxin-like protein
MVAKYIYAENTFKTTTQSPPVPGTVTVEEDAFIVTPNTAGFDLISGGWTFQANGTIDGQLFGIHLEPNLATLAKNSLITIGAEGTVIGEGSVGIYTQSPVDVTNSGLVRGGSFGFYTIGFGPTTSKGFTITNNKSGDIVGASGGIYDADFDHRITVKNQGTIGGASGIEWAGSAVITNTGEIDGGIQSLNLAGTLSSSITNGGSVIGSIIFSDGDDTLKNTSLISGPVDFNEGKNSLTNTGTIQGTVSFGAGDDSMTNSGTIGGLVDFSDGKNTVTNSGTLTTGIQFGNGDDVFKNTGTVANLIKLGGGDNTFIGGNHTELIEDFGNNDTFKFGGGDDYLYTHAFGNNLCDGGAGVDTYSANFLGFVIFVNLDSKAATLDGHTLLASSAVALGHVDQIKGFEVVQGSNQGDLIVGGNGAEALSGGGGDDFLAGGLGADTLRGDSGADTFVLFQAKDSGKTHATRDTIADFEGAGVAGGDTIDVSAIDTNTKAIGDQDFIWIGGNTEFNHIAGELRFVTINGDTIVQGDVNGDGKVDFSIDVLGTQNLKAGDFAL